MEWVTPDPQLLPLALAHYMQSQIRQVQVSQLEAVQAEPKVIWKHFEHFHREGESQILSPLQ